MLWSWVALTFACVPWVAQGCWMNDQLHHQPTDFTQSREKILHLAVGLQDEQDFQDHLDQILIPRAVGSNNHTLVETYIQDTLTTLGWTVTLDRFTQETLVGPRTFTNIIADFDPSSPRRMIISAHYDSMVRIDGFVGATDSAVPTAMMLNLAHTMDIMFSDLLSSNPDLTPTLVFFDGEEAMDHWTSDDSLYGSTHLAELWFNQTFSDPNSDCTEPTTFMDRIDLLFLMDLLGTPKPNFQSFQFGDDGPDPYYPMLDQIEEAVDFFHPTSTSFMFNGVESISHVVDDCTPFWKLGLKRIFHWITRPFPTVWHTLADNKDALDFEYIKKMNMILRIFTAEYLKF